MQNQNAIKSFKVKAIKISLKTKKLKPINIDINKILKKLSFLLNLLAKLMTTNPKMTSRIGLNNSEIVDLNSMFMYGQIAVLLGTSSYALATVLTKKISHIPPTDRAIGSLLSASLIGFITAILFEPFPDLASLDIKTILLLFLLGAVSTGVATFVWFKIVDLEGPIFMSMVNYLIPVWALVLGIYLLDESINFAIIIGLAFIFSGIWLIQRKK